MHGTDMQFQIVPSLRDVLTSGLGTVETEEDQGFLHHLWSLEENAQLEVLVRNVGGRIG